MGRVGRVIGNTTNFFFWPELLLSLNVHPTVESLSRYFFSDAIVCSLYKKNKKVKI